MKGRNYSTLKGKFNLGEAITLYPWRGILVGRRMPKVIRMPLTKKVQNTKDAVMLASRALNDVDMKGRSEWGFAGSKYCAYLKWKHMTAKFQWYVARHYKEPTGWAAYFLFCNLIASHSDMSFPRMKAPLSGGNPPAPGVEWAKLSDDYRKIYGEIPVHPLQKYDFEFTLRIWLAGQYIMSIHQSIHKKIHLGPGPSKDQTKPVVVKFEFDAIRCAGLIFGQEYLPFKDMSFGSIYIYADCVTTYSSAHGPNISVNSDVREVIIPNHGHYVDGYKRYEFHPGMSIGKSGQRILKRLQMKNRERRHKLKAPVVYTKPKWEK